MKTAELSHSGSAVVPTRHKGHFKGSISCKTDSNNCSVTQEVQVHNTVDA